MTHSLPVIRCVEEASEPTLAAALALLDVPASHAEPLLADERRRGLVWGLAAALAAAPDGTGADAAMLEGLDGTLAFVPSAERRAVAVHRRDERGVTIAGGSLTFTRLPSPGLRGECVVSEVAALAVLPGGTLRHAAVARPFAVTASPRTDDEALLREALAVTTVVRAAFLDVDPSLPLLAGALLGWYLRHAGRGRLRLADDGAFRLA